MHNENDAAYQPDWASPPGRTILDIMSHRGIDSEELTTLLHMSAKNVRRLLHAEIPITSAIAHSLANALGVTYDFWMEREAVYQQDLQNKTSVENDWLALLPLKEMSDLGKASSA